MKHPEGDKTSTLSAIARLRQLACGIAILGALLVVSLAINGCAVTNSGPGQSISAARLASVSELGLGPQPSGEPFRFFSPTSFWNTPVPANAALDPTSTELVAAFDALVAGEQAAKAGPWINTTSYSVPIYKVPARQPTVRVRLENAHGRALQRALRAVPLPADARPSAGSDSVLIVWQPSTDRLWEFWRLKHGATGWYASWGGAMRHVSTDSGVNGPGAWPGAKSSWGSSASSLSLVGGLITLEDLQLGKINHALSIAVPDTRAGVYASPAQRTDGSSPSPLALPEGAHLRLNPSLDLAALHLPRLTLMIAEAAQRYGIFVRDTAHSIGFFAQDPTPTGVDPYAGVGGYFEGQRPSQLLAVFPWSELQLLKMELHGT